jgi:glyoxylase-like metal-dependent hydrolase (beta-lactamase superfamily II)
MEHCIRIGQTRHLDQCPAAPASHFMNTLIQLPDTMRVFERGWLSANNILFIGQDQTALVDSGYMTHAPLTLALVTNALQGRKLDWLINTHLHSDHCGGNAALQKTFACRTTIPEAEADKVRDWDEEALSFDATGQRCERFTFDDTLTAGDTIMLGNLSWQVLGAPGHDPHSLILYCESERILISADALWENGFGVIFPEVVGESGFAETRSTLEQIAALDVRLVIPGHGAPFTNVEAALKTALSRIDYLSSHPQSNAQHAVNVLLKFILLERQQIPLAEIPQLLATIPLFRAANERHLQLPLEELAQTIIKHLARAGAARVVGKYILNQG